MSFISTIIYLRNWLLLFGISNSFWDFPLFGLGGSLDFPLREKENDTEIGLSSFPYLKKMRKSFSLKKKVQG